MSARKVDVDELRRLSMRMTVGQLAAHFGCASEAIRYNAKQHNITIDRYGEVRPRFLEQYQSTDRRVADLAIEAGVSSTTAWKWLLEAGIDRRYEKHGRTGGHFNPPVLYKCWQNMRNRCNNPASRDYKWYGSRGIRVCVEWERFTTFEAWALASGWEPGLTIDRLDVNGHYEPNNCEWVSRAENTRRMAEYHRAKKQAERGAA